MSGELEGALLAGQLAKLALELAEANAKGDAEAERQAIFKANRLTSDELARREANAETDS